MNKQRESTNCENCRVTPIMLAPMEGVVDFDMRQLLTRLGGYDRCVTEFVRVTRVLLPERVFFRYCPELKTGSRTASGTPVYLQLLGSDTTAMALNAKRAEKLGAAGIDINFGCPAKTVNRNQGGSVLLKQPNQVAAIVDAVRQAVCPTVPVTAKIRLGYDHPDDVAEIAAAVASAGATQLCIHARTRQNGYKPPAYWHLVRQAVEAVSIPITVNGEIWSPQDAHNALRQSGASAVMLGRGALACPDLARRLRAELDGHSVAALDWSELAVEVVKQFDRSSDVSPRHIGNRTKQWLAYLKRQYSEAALLFNTIKRLHDAESIRPHIVEHTGLSYVAPDRSYASCGVQPAL